MASMVRLFVERSVLRRLARRCGLSGTTNSMTTEAAPRTLRGHLKPESPDARRKYLKFRCSDGSLPPAVCETATVTPGISPRASASPSRASAFKGFLWDCEL